MNMKYCSTMNLFLAVFILSNADEGNSNSRYRKHSGGMSILLVIVRRLLYGSLIIILNEFGFRAPFQQLHFEIIPITVN